MEDHRALKMNSYFREKQVIAIHWRCLQPIATVTACSLSLRNWPKKSIEVDAVGMAERVGSIYSCVGYLHAIMTMLCVFWRLRRVVISVSSVKFAFVCK